MRVFGVNDKGLRVGEDHQNAILTNDEVELIRDLRAQGLKYDTIAEKFEVSKSTIAMICRYERRAESATQFKTQDGRKL